MPRIYLISHYRERATEVWLHRVREALGNRVCGEAYFDVGSSRSENTYCLTPAWWKAVMKSGLASDWKYAPPRLSGLCDAIAESRADIVYCHFANLAVRLQRVWKKLAMPVAVHCHGFDVSFDLVDGKGRPKYSACYPQRVRSLVPQCHLIANSDSTRKKLLAIDVPGESVSTWHFGVPIQKVNRVLNDRGFMLLFLGRFIGCKGPKETLRAFCMARNRGLSAKLVMAGHGPLWDECRQLSVSLGIQDFVTFPGAVSSETASNLLRESHVFTSHTQTDPVTNQCEAFGVAYAEALGAGLPVVTGRHCGPATFLTHKHDSLLFEPGDIETHANLLLLAASDHELRSRLSRNAITTANERFDLDRQHIELVEMLTRISRRT